jgi:aerobic carbon-monoxide dehydrogenase medium subunit
MSTHIDRYFKPDSIAEALRLLGRRNTRTVALAGGTALLANPLSRPQAVVDLSGLGLDYIRQEGHTIAIGAMTSLQTLVTSPVIAGIADGLLAKAAHSSATRTIRNAATIGGTIIAGGPSSDLLAALLALEATATAASSVVMGVEDLVALKRTPQSMKLLLEVRLQLPPAPWCGALCRVARLPSDHAIVTVACAMRAVGGICQDIRLAAGGVGPAPLRLRAAEEIVRGSRLDDAVLQQTADTQQKHLSPPADFRGSAEYRRAMLGVLVRRAVQQCMARESER